MPVCQPALAQYLQTYNESCRQQSPRDCKDTQFSNTDTLVRIKDIIQQGKVNIEVPEPDITPEDILFRGAFFRRELRQGLRIQCGNAFEEHAYAASSFQGAGLSCVFFLEGDIEVSIGDRTFNLSAEPGHSVEALAFIKPGKVPFQRVTRKPQKVRHLVIAVSPEWLKQREIISADFSNNFQETSLSVKQACHWRASSRVKQLVEEIFRPTVLRPELLNLYLECRAVELIMESLDCILKIHSKQNNASVLSRHDTARLQRARELILAKPDQHLSVERIARAANISPSGLQKLFHRAEGLSVFAYIRQSRMQHALAALRSGDYSVKQASSIIGYKSPENFATAFKKQFGMTPRQVINSNKVMK